MNQVSNTQKKYFLELNKLFLDKHVTKLLQNQPDIIEDDHLADSNTQKPATKTKPQNLFPEQQRATAPSQEEQSIEMKKDSGSGKPQYSSTDILITAVPFISDNNSTPETKIYLFDIQTEKCRQQAKFGSSQELDLKSNNYPILLDDHQILMASEKKLFFHDLNSGKTQYIENRYAGNITDIHVSGKKLFMTSGDFDSILVLDTASRKFVEGYHIKHNKTANCIYPASFDPNSEKGASQENTLGLDSVFIKDNRLYFSCTRFDSLFYLETNGSLHFSISIPVQTTHIKPFKKGYLVHEKNSKEIIHLSPEGEPLTTYVLENPSIKDHTSQRSWPDSQSSRKMKDKTDSHDKETGRHSSLRDLLVTENDLIIAAISPGTLFVYEPGKPEPAAAMDISEKINGTITGLGNIHHSL